MKAAAVARLGLRARRQIAAELAETRERPLCGRRHQSVRLEVRPEQVRVNNEAPLRLILPGLVLPSLNRMIGSGKRNQQAQARQSIARHLEPFAKELARIHRFTVRVDLHILQSRASLRLIDPSNLYVKHLIDRCTEHNGLAIIVDDAPQYLRRLILENSRGDRDFVTATFTPVPPGPGDILIR